MDQIDCYKPIKQHKIAWIVHTADAVYSELPFWPGSPRSSFAILVSKKLADYICKEAPLFLEAFKVTSFFSNQRIFILNVFTRGNYFWFVIS